MHHYLCVYIYICLEVKSPVFGVKNVLFPHCGFTANTFGEPAGCAWSRAWHGLQIGISVYSKQYSTNLS